MRKSWINHIKANFRVHVQGFLPTFWITPTAFPLLSDPLLKHPLLSGSSLKLAPRFPLSFVLLSGPLLKLAPPLSAFICPTLRSTPKACPSTLRSTPKACSPTFRSTPTPLLIHVYRYLSFSHSDSTDSATVIPIPVVSIIFISSMIALEVINYQ